MSNLKQDGCLFIVSAPSGSGKSTLCNMMLREFKQLKYSVSYTTRKPRPGETEGIEYNFVDESVFKKMVEAGDFLEWEEVHGNFYGTSRKTIEKAIGDGEDIFLDIDPKGAMHLKKKMKHAVFIFIVAPSFEILRERLVKRGTDSPENIELRMTNAQKEIEYFKNYDYLIINDDSVSAFNDMKAVYRAEKLRTSRIRQELDF